MTFEELTEITADRINNFMAEAINTDSKRVAEMFLNAAWGVRSLWFELCAKMDLDLYKKDKLACQVLRGKIDKQNVKFIQLIDRERVPLLKLPEKHY